MSSRKVKASPASGGSVRAQMRLIVWCRVSNSSQTHIQPDVRWSDINREAENEITSYSANQKTLFPPRSYFGAAKLLLGESRPDSMRRQPFLISSGIVAARSKWIDDPITTRCLQSAARRGDRRRDNVHLRPLEWIHEREWHLLRGCGFLYRWLLAA